MNDELPRSPDDERSTPSEDLLRPDAHVELDVVRRFGERRLGRERSFRVAWHLFLCERCRPLLDRAGPRARRLFEAAFPDGPPAAPSTTGPEMGSVFRRVGRVLAERGGRIVRERGAAARLLSELEDHPPSRRRSLVETERRFRTYGLAERLLDECRRRWSDDPARAEELAELAVAVVESLRPQDYSPALLEDLAAEAWAAIANCRRIRADFLRVEEAFEIAEEHRHRGSGDPFEEAALLDLQASARFDQRRLGEAEELLRRAIDLYRKTGDRHQEGRVLMKLARVRHEQGRTAEAITMLDAARELVDTSREPRARLALEQHLAVYLREAGVLDAAGEALTTARRLAEEVGSRADRLRVLWSEGALLHRKGLLRRAEAILRDVREGFLHADLGYDAALVALDLALVVLESGYSGRARALAAELVPLFRARGIHREALAALAIVQQALQTEKASLALIRDAAVFLRRARRNPALRFGRRWFEAGAHSSSFPSRAPLLASASTPKREPRQAPPTLKVGRRPVG